MLRTWQLKGRVKNLQQRRQHCLTFDKIEPQDLESFDLEFSPSGQIVRETHYTFARNVYGSRQFYYDEAGRHLKTVSRDSADHETGRIEYDYDKSGREICSTTYDINNEVLRRCVCTLGGDKISAEAIYEDNTALRRRKDYQYKEGKLAQTISRYFSPDGSLREQQITGFDREGRVSSAYGLTASGEPLGDGKYLHEYDAEGRESRRLTLDEFDVEKPPKCEEVYEYSSDKHGNWIQRRARSKWVQDTN